MRQQVAQTNSIEDLEEKGFFAAGQGKDQKCKSNSSAVEDTKMALSKMQHVGLITQTWLLFDREIKKLYRDKLSFVVRVVSAAIFGLLFGLIFHQVGKSSYLEYPQVMASFGGRFFVLIVLLLL